MTRAEIRVWLPLLAVVCAMVLGIGLTGCSGGSGSSSSSAADGSSTASIKIGTMQTEDSLPFWAADEQGYFDQEGVQVEMVTFQSAQELSTAFAAGEIDAAMTDVQQAATLKQAGTDMVLEWVTLGTDASQGRFGIMTSPDSGITSLSQLAGVPIGVGSNTVPEYVMDKLMENAGVPDDQIVNEEIKKIPVRYESMANNQVAAAALPASMLALGEAQGMVLLADDTTGDNISQSVMVVRANYLQGNGASAGQAAVDKVASAWNKAADDINASPENYRDLLVKTANLPDQVADTYTICTYPQTTRPTADMVQPVLDWMLQKGYLEKALTYDEATGTFL